MTRLTLIAASVFALAGCNTPPATTAPGEAAKLKNGEVALVATAPDGTKLWAVQASRIVYFSSSGTQTHHKENCGKSCWRTVDDAVPAVTDDPLAPPSTP